MDWRRAIGAHHWLFLAQPEPFPEYMIGLDPVFYLHSRLSAWAGAGFDITCSGTLPPATAGASPSKATGTNATPRAAATRPPTPAGGVR